MPLWVKMATNPHHIRSKKPLQQNSPTHYKKYIPHPKKQGTVDTKETLRKTNYLEKFQNCENIGLSITCPIREQQVHDHTPEIIRHKLKLNKLKSYIWETNTGIQPPFDMSNPTVNQQKCKIKPGYRFKIVALNCKGLIDRTKQIDIGNWLKHTNLDILTLLETNIKSNEPEIREGYIWYFGSNFKHSGNGKRQKQGNRRGGNRY